MQEEIKEILQILEAMASNDDIAFLPRQASLLLDYITNLQEENEYSNHCNEELRKKITNLEYKIERLEEDNKQLKELCDKYEEEHKTTFEEWKKDINIIDELEKFFKYEFDNEVRPLNSYKVSVWTICLDKLNELKGDNK